MAKKSPTVVTLKEYVLGIAKVFPDAFFSGFSRNGRPILHRIRPSKLLYAKQIVPDIVTCAFYGNGYYISISWQDNRIQGNGLPFHQYERYRVPDELTSFVLNSTLAKLNNLLNVLKKDPEIKCDAFTRVMHQLDVIRTADAFDDDDDD